MEERRGEKEKTFELQSSPNDQMLYNFVWFLNGQPKCLMAFCSQKERKVNIEII